MRKRSVKQKYEKAMRKLAAAELRLENADSPKEATNARMSVNAHKRSIAALARQAGERNLELEKEIKIERKGRLEKVRIARERREVRKEFYFSDNWRAVRYRALLKHGRKCQCCGATPGTGAVLHVDHIKPRSLHPEMELELENLQILCADCNLGKSNLDDTDFR